MTAQDARERAWQEYAQPRGLGTEGNRDLSFRAGWDAAKREDEQRIAELVDDEATIAKLVATMRQVPDIVSQTREFTYPDLPRMAKAMLRALAGSEESAE